ncbi:hypothetical protein HIM_07182 [Hirsutella minnesotensis 3608]|uniref:Uncharacterized protein n=1 Tax=Hirsutella minnesotensis 3608 TaxID=1043627 RepID=A0A0F7ZTM8_9HYPO|nr:hypothetical protein HIM_07182 [Hirsutella minnesotensis 3608]
MSRPWPSLVMHAQTDPSVQSVHLIGSWDNFCSSYAMKQDVRRGRGQWRGCYSFTDIVCDNKSTIAAHRRNGGLRMGATYYYYYEINGSTETHDPAEPWTTACPYLPGQTVNSLTVPVERTLRKRSASLSSVRQESFKTMNPDAKFMTPKPVESPLSGERARRLASAPSSLACTSTPCPPPTSSWRRFFTRKLPARNGGSSDSCSRLSGHSAPNLVDERSCRATNCNEGGSRLRDLSPDSLRQFFQQDTRSVAKPEPEMPALRISEDSTDDADEDNFATLNPPETQLYVTSLSPPPYQRSASAETVARIVTNSSSLTITAERLSNNTQERNTAQQRMLKSGGEALPKLETGSEIRWSISAISSFLADPVSPQSTEDEFSSFYDSNDDDDVLSSHYGDASSPTQALEPLLAQEPFKGYSLPRQHNEGNCEDNSKAAISRLQPPCVLTRSDYNNHLNDTKILGANIDSGLDDLVNELGWIVDAIGAGDH